LTTILLLPLTDAIFQLLAPNDRQRLSCLTP
jgi:hypothetical protein